MEQGTFGLRKNVLRSKYGSPPYSSAVDSVIQDIEGNGD